MDFDAWLEQLPYSAPAPQSDLVVEALLMRSGPGRVRLAMRGLCLEVDAADVTRIERLPEPVPDGEPRMAVRVRASLRFGFRVTAVAPTLGYRDLLSSRRPFAISARPQPPPVAGGASFRAAEEAFFRSPAG